MDPAATVDGPTVPRTRVRGVRVDGSGGGPRTWPKDRVCAARGCGTRLSIYNGGDYCWVHTPVRFPPGPVGPGRRRRVETVRALVEGRAR